MVNQFQVVNQKWVVLSKRDRLMLFLVGLFGIAGLLDTYLTEPIRQQKVIATQELDKLASDTANVELQMTKLSASGESANSALQKQIQNYKTQISLQEKTLKDLGSMMVTPQEIAGLMRNLLQQHEQVRVMSMESLPPVSFVKKLTADKSAVANPADPQVDLGVMFQHVIRLKLQGGFMALMQYVADLKALGSVVGWENAELKSNYPDSELTLEVYTLSPQKPWLGI